MANIYLQNTVFCVAGFLLGVSVSATFARGDAAHETADIAQDILAQPSRVRLQVKPNVAKRKGLEGQTTAAIEEVLAAADVKNAANTNIEASLEPQSNRPDEQQITTETTILTPEVDAAAMAATEGFKETTQGGQQIASLTRPSEANTNPSPMANSDETADTVSSPTIEYGLHLASLSRPENVAEMIENLEDAFTDELSERSFYEIEGENSITGRRFIRLVSAGYENRDAALSQCDRLKAQGQYCAVVQIQR